MSNVLNGFRQAGSDGNNALYVYGDVDANGTVFTAEQVRQSLLTRLDSVVIVHSADDLAGELDSTKLYLIDGRIDMGSTQIQVPEGGLNMSGLNGGKNVSVLYSDEDNYEMFIVDPNGDYSGDIVFDNLTIDVTGINSMVFDLDNDENSGSLNITNVDFGMPDDTATNIGSLTAYRLMFMDTVRFYIDEGFTLNGTWAGGLVIVDCIMISPSFAGTLFKVGTDFVLQGSSRSNMNFLLVDDSAVFTDISPSNVLSDSGFILDNFRTSADDPLPNLPPSSVKSRFKNGVGIDNTYVGGRWVCSATAVTNIVSSGTLVKVAGTTTYSDMVHFSQSTNNAFVNANSRFGSIRVSGNIALSGDANDSLSLVVRKWDSSASAYVDVSPEFTRTIENSAGGIDVALIPFETFVSDVDANDRIELWVKNNTDTSDVTMRVGSYANISERV